MNRARDLSRAPAAASLLAGATATFAVKLLVVIRRVVRADLVGCQSLRPTGTTGPHRQRKEGWCQSLQHLCSSFAAGPFAARSFTYEGILWHPEGRLAHP